MKTVKTTGVRKHEQLRKDRQMKKTKGQGTGKCAVWGLLKEWKELRGDVQRLFDLLQSVMKELAEVRKMLKEGAGSNGR